MKRNQRNVQVCGTKDHDQPNQMPWRNQEAPLPRKGPRPSTHEYHPYCSIKPLQYCDRIRNQIEKHSVQQQIPENRASGHASESPMPLTAQEEY
jgi:hypothetical protein